MSSQENDGTSRNPCANGCGSLVPAENSNYCNNCFKLLLAEEQAAVTAAETAEAAYSNETNPGENWVRAQMSTITLEQWISMIRRKERARQFEDSPLSFSELLGITRRNDDRGDELDTMESSSTVPPPLTLGSESNECSRSGEVEQARVGLIEEKKFDTYNTPYYEPYTEDVKAEIKKEGSFILDHLKITAIPWDGANGGNEYDRTKTAEIMGKMIRAFNESVIHSHFGSEIMDRLFQRFTEIVAADTKEVEHIGAVFSLIRKSH
ncbi:hypothetical protein Patl1_29121 [Pistacia atlantica]|uniref:Uncharacterized protein n=1 Tax=Pistacia atlantica TaxID=434234 RepID=A0ACC1BE51_9ROSI|nr:hypothetical protein Patl1_29121 [Pistacia atlantica]